VSGQAPRTLTKRRAPLFKSRNASFAQQGVTAGEKSSGERIVTDTKNPPGAKFPDAVRRAQADSGQCEHGKPLLFGGCKECARLRIAKARERFARGVDAKATAETCGMCGRDMAPTETVVIRSMPSYSVSGGRSFVPVCAECGKLGERSAEMQPCYWCDRPVFMLYEVWAARPNRIGVFCCDRCRYKWHNRRHSEIRKRQRQRFLAKTCEVCGEAFTATRVDTKTCSPACRQRAYRRRKAGAS
jgi:hypothetical protein